MFHSTQPEPSGLESAITDLLSEMKGVTGDSEDYASMATQLERLYKLKDIDKPERIKPDTLVVIAGNIIVALVIVQFEKENIVTSKALNFMLKARQNI